MRWIRILVALTCIMAVEVADPAVEVQPLLSGEGQLAAIVWASMMVGHVGVQMSIVLTLSHKLGTAF